MIDWKNKLISEIETLIKYFDSSFDRVAIKVFESELAAFKNILMNIDSFGEAEINSKVRKYWHLHQIKTLMYFNWKTIAVEAMCIDKNSNKLIDMLDDFFWRIPELSSNENEKGKFGNTKLRTKKYNLIEKYIDNFNNLGNSDIQKCGIDLGINTLEQKEPISLKSLKKLRHLEHTVPRALIKLYIEFKCIFYYKYYPLKGNNASDQTSFWLKGVFKFLTLKKTKMNENVFEPYWHYIARDIEQIVMPLNICCAMSKNERKFEKNILCLKFEKNKLLIFFDSEKDSQIDCLIRQNITDTGRLSLRQSFEKKLEENKENICDELCLKRNTPTEEIAFIILRHIFEKFWETPLMRYSREIRVLNINSESDYYDNLKKWEKEDVKKINHFGEFMT